MEQQKTIANMNTLQNYLPLTLQYVAANGWAHEAYAKYIAWKKQLKK